MKQFWLSFFHLAMMGGAAYISVKYPTIAPFVVPVLVGASGVAPSPVPSMNIPPAPAPK